MPHIPETLHDKGLRFIKVAENGKQPVESQWQTVNNYSHDDDELQTWLENGGNYGVVCGATRNDNFLVVVDADDPRFSELVKDAFPDTLSVETSYKEGERMTHHYFFLDEECEKIVFKDPQNSQHLGEMQSENFYVVGPTSQHPSGITYDITDEEDIEHVEKEMLTYALGELIPDSHDESRVEHTADREHDTELETQGLPDVTELVNPEENDMKFQGVRGEWQGSHPVHGSTTGHNFTLHPEKNSWHCFRHNVGGYSLELLALVEGVTTCEALSDNGLQGEVFKKTVDIAEEKYDATINIGVDTEEEVNEILDNIHDGMTRQEMKDVIDDIQSLNEDFNKAHCEEELKQVSNLNKSDIKSLTRRNNTTPEERIAERYEQGEVSDVEQFKQDIRKQPQNAYHAIALYLINKYHIKTVINGKMYRYSNGVYSEEGEPFIRGEIEDLYGPVVKTQYVNEVVKKIQRMTYIKRDEFQAPQELICLENGIYNLEQDEFIDHTPQYYFTSQLPVKYDAEATCEDIQDFVNDIVREEKVSLIQEMIATCLLRNSSLQKAFLLCDSGGGSSGKSTLLLLLKTFLGSDNTSHVSLQELLDNKFAMAELHQRLANIYYDLPKRDLQSESNFKALTGGDVIKGERKYQEPFSFRNYATLIFSSNTVPKVGEDFTDAFWRRWILISFPYTFKDNPDENDPFEKQAENQEELLKSLTHEEQLSGLFNWAVEALLRLQENNTYSITQSREEVREDWLKKSEPVKRFVEECCEVSVDTPPPFEIKEDLKHAYDTYCSQNDIEFMSKNKFSKTLDKLFNEVSIEGRRSVNDERKRCYECIKLKEDYRGEKWVTTNRHSESSGKEEEEHGGEQEEHDDVEKLKKF